MAGRRRRKRRRRRREEEEGGGGGGGGGGKGYVASWNFVLIEFEESDANHPPAPSHPKQTSPTALPPALDMPSSPDNPPTFSSLCKDLGFTRNSPMQAMLASPLTWQQSEWNSYVLRPPPPPSSASALARLCPCLAATTCALPSSAGGPCQMNGRDGRRLCGQPSAGAIYHSNAALNP